MINFPSSSNQLISNKILQATSNSQVNSANSLCELVTGSSLIFRQVPDFTSCTYPKHQIPINKKYNIEIMIPQKGVKSSNETSSKR